MVTSEEVARLAGVSRATVSRALNGSAKVSEETRKRVEQAVLALGYEPDVVAQSLARQSSRTIALCMFIGTGGSFSQFSETQHYFYLNMLREIEQAVTAARYDLLLPATPSEQKNFVRSLQTRRVAGLLTMSLDPNDERFHAILDADLPAVFIDGIKHGKRATYVISDNGDGAWQATEYLLQLGHRRIAVFPGTTVGPISQERLLGCQRRLIQAGLELDPGLLRVSGWNTEDAYRAMVGLLAERQDFTAVLAGSDLMALGILRALREHGLRVPDDVSLIGFDDVELCRYIDPPLTTVRQNCAAMGAGAVQRLIAMIEGSLPTSPLIVPTQLIERASTASVRSA